MTGQIFIGIDTGIGPDRTAEVEYCILPDGRLEIIDMRSYTETIDLPRRTPGSFGDSE